MASASTSSMFDNPVNGWWVTIAILGIVVVGTAGLVAYGKIRARVIKRRSQDDAIKEQRARSAAEYRARVADRAATTAAEVAPEAEPIDEPENVAAYMPIEEDPIEAEPRPDPDSLDPYADDKAEGRALASTTWRDVASGELVDDGETTQAMSRAARRREGIARPFEAIRSETGTYNVTTAAPAAEFDHQERRDGRMPVSPLSGDWHAPSYEPAVLSFGEPAERPDLTFTGQFWMDPIPAEDVPVDAPKQLVAAGRPRRGKRGKR